jgi:hypothetical protein
VPKFLNQDKNSYNPLSIGVTGVLKKIKLNYQQKTNPKILGFSQNIGN